MEDITIYDALWYSFLTLFGFATVGAGFALCAFVFFFLSSVFLDLPSRISYHVRNGGSVWGAVKYWWKHEVWDFM